MKWTRGAAIALSFAGSAVADQLERTIPEDAGSREAPLLFCIGMHIEPFGAAVSTNIAGRAEGPRDRPGPDYRRPMFFQRQVEDIRAVARIVERHNGRMTVQAQTPFTQVAAESGNMVLADLAKAGHEIALHLHEDAHLGRGSERLTVEQWVPVLREQLDWLHKAGGKRIRYWSGGNLFPGILAAAAQVGLDTMSDYKNPRLQQSDPRLLAIHPWRPAGGPAEGDLDAFCRHDPQGRIVYLPDGLFARTDHAGMRRAETTGGDWKYFDFLTEGLERSLRAARPDRVNVFHFTVHAGEFRGRGGEPFAVIDAWLGGVLDPLVKSGRVRWATFGEMGDAYRAWERKHPGVDPRAPATQGASAPAAPPAAPRGYMNFAVNVHDWLLIDESAATLAKLTDLFATNRVRADFYFTGPVTGQLLEKHPEVVARIKAAGQGIGYHTRAPHPLWQDRGRLFRGKTEAEAAALLRDYESFALDLRTGELDRSRPGGYRLVASTFGTNPVVVGAMNVSPEIRGMASRVYRELGARMAVFYHETGTDPAQPFRLREGLLERPSDFSITRFDEPGAPEGLFWWSMQDTPRAAEFDPVALLEKKLAAWGGTRPPFITALIHENDFYRQGGPGWSAIYFSGRGPGSRPKSPPYDLATPPSGEAWSAATRARILTKYGELVAYAAKNLKVVTASDIVAMAQ